MRGHRTWVRRNCVQCGRLRRVARKGPDGPICVPCREGPEAKARLCPHCLQPRRLARRIDGVSVCETCAQRRRKPSLCSECGAPAKRGGLCTTHVYHKYLSRQPRGQCRSCGREQERLVRDECARCRNRESCRRSVAAALAELFGTHVQQAQLAALIDYLVRHRDPTYVAQWLRVLAPGIVKYLMRAVAGHELDAHEIVALHDLPGGAFLLDAVTRSGCVAQPSLSSRCKRFADELAWGTSIVVRSSLEAYFAYYDRELLRLRDDKHAPSWNVPPADRRKLRTALQILQWCEIQAGSPEDVTPAQLEVLLSKKSNIYRRDAAQFLTWLADAGKLHFRPQPFRRHCPPSPRLGEPAFQDVLHRALHDETLPLRVRAMLIFIILACRMPAEVCSLRRSVVSVRSPNRVEVRFAHGIPQLFEGHAARLLINLAQSDSVWLFPSHALSGHLVAGTMKFFFRQHALPLPRVLHNSALWEKLEDHSVTELALILGKTTSWVECVKTRLNPIDPAHRAYISQVAAR